MNKKESRPCPGPAPTKTTLAEEITESAGPVSSAETYRGGTSPDQGAPLSSTTWRRTQFVHDLRSRRRISRELDSLCGVESAAPFRLAIHDVENCRRVDAGDRWADMGYTLGAAERVAAGRKLTASSSVSPILILGDGGLRGAA